MDRGRLFEKICRMTVEMSGVDAAWIGLLDEGTGKVRPVAQVGFEDVSAVRFESELADLEETPIGRAVLSGKPYSVQDVEAETTLGLWRDEALKRGYRSAAAIPLVVDGSPIGALGLYSGKPGAFPEGRLRELEAFMEVAAVAIKSSQLLERERNYASRLEMYQRVIGSMLEEKGLESKLRTAIDSLMRVTGAEMGGIYLVEEDQLRLQVHRNMPDDLVAAIRYYRFTGESFPFKPGITRERLSDEGGICDLLKRHGIQSLIYHPLRTKEEVVGALILASPRYDAFPDELDRTLPPLLDLISLIISHSALLRKSAERLARLSILRDIDKAIVSELSIGRVVDAILEHVSAVSEVDMVGVSLLDRRSMRFDLIRFKLPDGSRIEEEPFKLADSLMDQLVSKGEPVIIYDLAADPRVQGYLESISKERLCSYLGVPMRTAEGTIGVLHLITRSPKRFSKEELEFLTMLAGQTAIAIQNSVLYEAALRRSRALEALAELSLLISKSESPGKEMGRAIDLIRRATGADGVIYFELDRGRDLFVLKEATGEPHLADRSLTLPRERVELFDRANPSPLYMPDLNGGSPLIPLKGLISAKSAYLLPIASPRSIHGVLMLTSSKRDGFDPDSRAMADMAVSLLNSAFERAELLERLKNEERFTREMLEAAGALVLALDEEGKIRIFNRTAEIATGYSKDEALGKRFASLFLRPAQRITFERYVGEVLEGEGRPGLREEVIITKEGEKHIGWSDAVIEINGSKMLLRFGVDVTEKRNLEKQYLRAQRMEILGQLAATIVHDFNNALSGVIGFAQMAEVSAQLIGDENLREWLRIILNSAERAERVARQLLTFSRREPMEMNLVDPNHIVETLSRTYQKLLGEGIELKVDLEGDIPLITADEGQVEQAIINLVINARDAMPRGGEVTIRTRLEELEETAARRLGVEPGKYVRIDVQDTGTGIPPEIRDRIFDPFFTTKGEKGTGLGLASVYTIMRRHNGAVTFQTEVGVGTTFSLYFPAVELREMARPERPEERLPGGSETVLVADDDETVREALEAILSSLGYRVLTASNGEEAMSLLDECREIEAAILDLAMPDMSGLEIFRHIKEEHPNVKVMLMTGYPAGASELSQRRRRDGFKFIQKPISAVKLAKALREMLEG